MGKRVAGVLICFWLLVLVAGCGLPQQNSNEIWESYFPHAEGNSWGMLNLGGSYTVMTVEGVVTVEGITAKRFVSTFTHPLYGSSTSESYYRIDSSGVYFHGSSGFFTTESLAVLCFPLEVGKSWLVHNSGVTGSILARENITVPAGTFDCYKLALVSTYIINGVTRESVNYAWLSNNVGIVKSASGPGNSTYESVLEWKNF